MRQRALYEFAGMKLFFRYKMADGTSVFVKAVKKGVFRRHYEPDYSTSLEIPFGNDAEYVGLVYTKEEKKNNC